ncbi:hypothetical protein TSH7_09810 [Azospirillum sp. TSH7]|uniref:hypothetical protein n=1 Tax=unclassified Azospirillum TaxID=2630922 RepID=UPI000D60D94E|nr:MULTISPECIES: hypothetical protein [unclassified Azospirillum]PWC64830.1 hypothetical protein TSH7_09810 [Azospirillum sp. TSH7]
MAANPIERQLAEQYRALGITSVMVTVEGRRQNMKRMTCSCCGARDQVKLSVHMPPPQAARRFTNAGWQVGPEPVCPDCVERKREKRGEAAELRQQIVTLEREAHGLKEMIQELEAAAHTLRSRVDALV